MEYQNLRLFDFIEQTFLTEKLLKGYHRFNFWHESETDYCVVRSSRTTKKALIITTYNKFKPFHDLLCLQVTFPPLTARRRQLFGALLNHKLPRLWPVSGWHQEIIIETEIGIFRLWPVWTSFHNPLRKRERTGKEYGCFRFGRKTKMLKWRIN